MAKTAVYTPSVNITGDGLTYNEANPNTNINAPPPGSMLLSAGANTVNLPTGYTVNGVKIVPPVGNTVTLAYEGRGMHPTIEFCATFASGVSAFVLTAGGSVNVALVWF